MSAKNPPVPKGLTSPFFLPLTLLALTLVVFGPTLFAAGQKMMGYGGADLPQYFVYCREFGAKQMRQGHIPLWNPHICGGVPFVGAWQSGLFYPVNWSYLLLPLDKAINLELITHVFLAGWFTALWAAKHKFHPLACLLAGTMVMFGGPFYLHVFAGHLSLLAACAWMPLLLLTVDNLLETTKDEGRKTNDGRRTTGWIFVGVFAFAMQILAGHPQTVFITLVTVSLYALCLLFRSKQRLRGLLALVVVALGGVGIGAVQLLTGLQAASEGVRRGALPYEMAAGFSLPPQNLFTLLVPGFFGDMLRTDYWGGYFLWEMTLFVGVIGLMFAVYGVARGGDSRRWVWLALAIVLLVLALAGFTPLFRLLYEFVPGFNKFRGHSKFNYPAILFLALLAAAGLDRLLQNARRTPNFAAAVLVGALLLGGLGLFLQSGVEEDLGLWKKVAYDLAAREKSYVPAEEFADVEFINKTRAFAGTQCLIAGGVLLVSGILLLLQQRSRHFVTALAVLGIVEMALFARAMSAQFPLSATRRPEIETIVAEQPGDYRVLNLMGRTNSAMVNGAYDIWGYEPAVSGRYAEFMKRSQNSNPDDGDSMVSMQQAGKVMTLLRMRFLVVPQGQQANIGEVKNPLPHVFLVNEHRVLTGRDPIYSAVEAEEFDPRKSVLLESEPDPAPKPTKQAGTARVVSQTTDTLTIEADTPVPSILVITDGYSRAWRAVALPGSSQQSYTVQPADYILRAVPLAAGKHRLRLEYSPVEYRIGLWISCVSALVFLALLIRYGLRKSRHELVSTGARPA